MRRDWRSRLAPPGEGQFWSARSARSDGTAPSSALLSIGEDLLVAGLDLLEADWSAFVLFSYQAANRGP